MKVSDCDWTDLGFSVELGEERGWNQVAALAEVRERRRERPPIGVAEPARVERGTSRVAGGERDAPRFFIVLGNEHAAILNQATDLVVQAKQESDGSGIGGHLREGEREPGRGRNQSRRDHHGVQDAEDPVEVEAMVSELVELVFREGDVHRACHARTLPRRPDEGNGAHRAVYGIACAHWGRASRLAA
ncbi:MAG: hypothetical protein NT062_29670, partial [Proteobacteria bacterium]|nr:hypothetical protein [Pseudomonadota bacterium]